MHTSGQPGAWLEWISAPDRPSPWEAWRAAPLWRAMPTEEGVLAAYYRREHGVAIAAYRQVEVQRERDARLLYERGAVVGFRGERGLVIRVQVEAGDAPLMRGQGWRDVAD